MQWVNLVNEALFVNNSNIVLADKNEFGMRNVELSPVRRAYFKRTKSTAADALFQFPNIHGKNVRAALTAVNLLRLYRLGSLLRLNRAGLAVGALRLLRRCGCGVRLRVPRLLGALVAA